MSRAVRPAISAGVHSNKSMAKSRCLRCSTCHFGRCSQLAIYSDGKDFGCSTCHFGRCSQLTPDLQRGEIRLFDLPFRQVFTASAPMIIKQTKAVRPAISAGVHSRSFVRSSDVPTLFDLPFRQVFTAKAAKAIAKAGAVRPAISAGVHSKRRTMPGHWAAVRPAISAGVHSLMPWIDDEVTAVRPAISAGVHSPSMTDGSDSLAVRPAISAGVHSQGDTSMGYTVGCSTCHFGRCSQPRPAAPIHSIVLFDLPFRQVFTAPFRDSHATNQAVRPAISAGVHSNIPVPVVHGPGCSTCHFGRCSQPHPAATPCHESLFDLPFRQVFTADTL